MKMNKYLLYMFLTLCTIQQFHSQESNGVVALSLPVRNSFKFNRYAINPTFSFVREQNKYISFTNKKQWTQFTDAPNSYLFSFAGRFSENIGAGIGLFQQDFGVLTTFGGMLNFAYNASLSRESNLTFGLNIGAYQSGLNQGKVVFNTPDPSLQNVPSNFLLTVNPGINYGTAFFDFGVSINNLVSYNLSNSQIIKDNPEQGLQTHVMYTGYMNTRGFFDESKFTTLIRSEFKKDQTVISGLAMLNVPKGIWGQVGYNTLYGASAGIGINVTNNVAVEYNYEQSFSGFSEFGSSHEITLAYRFKNKNRYNYGDDEEEQSVFNTNRRRRKTNNLTEEDRIRIAQRRAELAEIRKARAAAQKAKAEEAKASKENDANNIAEKEAAAKLEADRLRLEAEASAEGQEQRRLQLEAERRAQEAKEKAATEAKKRKTEEEARIKAEEEARLKREAEEIQREIQEQRRLELEAERSAQEVKEKAAAEAEKRKAEEARNRAAAEKLRLEAEAEEERRLELLEAERQAQEAKEKAAIEAAKRKAEEEARIKAEEEARNRAAAEKLRLEAEAKAKAAAEEEERRLELEAERQAQEAKEKAAAEAAKRKAEEEARIKAEEEARLKREAEETEREIQEANDVDARAMNALVSASDGATKAQDDLMNRLSERIDVKQKDLDDLKKENDLSEQGIVLPPKPFKSTSAENRAIEALRDEIEKVEKEQEIKMIELEALLIKRKKKFRNDSAGVNEFYINALEQLKNQQVKIKNYKQSLLSNLERINKATEFERKRRIRRAAYDNQQDRYDKDKAALERIRNNTTRSNVPLNKGDFDFGEKQTKNIQIVKNVLNEDPGYYMVIAVHKNVQKRDEFVRKVVASGEKNVNFFFDVKTNKYFIYYEKYDSIGPAKSALDKEGSKPYNGSMSLIKIEN